MHLLYKQIIIHVHTSSNNHALIYIDSVGILKAYPSYCSRLPTQLKLRANCMAD